MDLIRPAYLNDQEKMIELNNIMEEVGLLHDKRHIEQKEKIEQLRTEICRLNKMLFTASNDQTLYRSYSTLSTMHPGRKN
jgi:RNase adaptor protein for sRNA GlmZ degradation